MDNGNEEVSSHPNVNPESNSNLAPDSTRQVLRSGWVSRPPGNWWNATASTEDHNALIAIATKDNPKSYKEAVSGSDARFWQKGIDSEISFLKKYKTWKFVPRSEGKGRKVLTTRWVFIEKQEVCLLYTSPSPRDQRGSRMPSSA